MNRAAIRGRGLDPGFLRVELVADVGQDEASGVGLGRVLARLSSGQVTARLLLFRLRKRRLEHQQIRTLCEIDESLRGRASTEERRVGKDRVSTVSSRRGA